jgi:hypothetical protein
MNDSDDGTEVLGIIDSTLEKLETIRMEKGMHCDRQIPAATRQKAEAFCDKAEAFLTSVRDWLIDKGEVTEDQYKAITGFQRGANSWLKYK